MLRLESHSVRAHGLLLASDARAEGWSSRLQTAARRGELKKVRPGVYITGTAWDAMSPEDRYRARLHAVAMTFRNPVFAHQSAAMLHGLPLLRERLDRVHLHQTTPAGSRRRGDVTVHASARDPDIVERGAMRMTSPTRTVIDLARTLPHAEALALADAAIRSPDATAADAGSGAALCTLSELTDAASALISERGGWSAFLAVSAADPLSGSVGESISRSLFLRMGVPLPELQVEFRDDDGLIGYADFWWREYGVIGEFDGRLKYGADNPSGLAPEDVVYREKLREDRMRRRCDHFLRFGWREANSAAHMGPLLAAAGIPFDVRCASPELRPDLPTVGTSAARRAIS